MVVCAISLYCKVMQSRQEIADDWTNQRCKPQNIMFAGWITHPDNRTPFEYTNDNFQYCIQNTLKHVSENALSPSQYMVKSLSMVMGSFVQSLQNTRSTVSQLRDGVSSFGEDVLSRVLNVTIPIQKMMISVMDVFQKIQGSMTASLYTMLGSYYALQSLMGAIVELIIKMLIALVLIIVGLWIMPFSWPAAASMTAVFTSIAIPLSIIIYFMTDVLHVKTSSIPKLRCFDENTLFEVSSSSFSSSSSSSFVKIRDIKVGDVLKGGDNTFDNVVTAIFKVSSLDVDMYRLGNVCVSGTHLVFDTSQEKWVRVSNHPNAVKLDTSYSHPYLYCLNTTKHMFVCEPEQTYLFSDWNEAFVNVPGEEDNGLEWNAKVVMGNNACVNVCDVCIGDTLMSGGVVYGLVQLSNFKYHLLTTNGMLFVQQDKDKNMINVNDYNYKIDKFLSTHYTKDKKQKTKKRKKKKEKMEMTIGRFKLRVEIIVGIILVSMVLFGNLFCGCSRVSLFEGLSMLRENFTTNANNAAFSPEFAKARAPGYILNPNTWAMPTLSYTPGSPPNAGVSAVWNRPKQPIPLPPGELDMFATTEFKPECCPNTYSNSSGCACMTVDQYRYLKTRGSNNVPYSEY